MLSVLLVSGTAAAVWTYVRTVKGWRGVDERYNLFSIVQTGPEREALATTYLAELLGLSVDQPVNLYRFDSAEGRRKLLASPLIKEAQVKTFLPGIVYIEYVARKPIAYVGDYSNTAIDADGALIPCVPFFTPKKLPQIYLGLPQQPRIWGSRVRGQQLELALAMRREIEVAFKGSELALKRIDVSQAFASSIGQRQVVLELEERLEPSAQGPARLYVQPVFLRLDPTRYREAFDDYRLLRDYLRQQMAKTPPPETESQVTLETLAIDLRLPQLAYINHTVKE